MKKEAVKVNKQAPVYQCISLGCFFEGASLCIRRLHANGAVGFS